MKCPLCSGLVSYAGLVSVECTTRGCPNGPQGVPPLRWEWIGHAGAAYRGDELVGMVVGYLYGWWAWRWLPTGEYGGATDQAGAESEILSRA